MLIEGVALTAENYGDRYRNTETDQRILLIVASPNPFVGNCVVACFLRGLGLRCPLLTKNVITAWIARCEMGSDAMAHSGISKLSTMPAMGQ
jgi:hypothetical protein